MKLINGKTVKNILKMILKIIEENLEKLKRIQEKNVN